MGLERFGGSQRVVLLVLFWRKEEFWWKMSVLYSARHRMSQVGEDSVG